jgi:VIT1/CCC1 family predicted Fe2+/Mn2+ transporter
MRLTRESFRRNALLSSVTGLTDGILTALTLAAGAIVAPGGHPVSVSLALRIAVAALASGAFVFYVAQYSHLRGELVRLEKQLSVTEHGRFAATRLGRQVATEAFTTATVSSSASFVGALIPLLLGALFPSFRWAAIVASVGLLGVLGSILARVVRGSFWRWPAALMTGGIALSILGAALHVV